MTDKERILSLIEELNKASDAYYNGKQEIMSNYEWDKKFDELSALEKKTGILFDNSPTRNVGYANAKAKVKHRVKALSLQKSKKVPDLIKWLGKQRGYLSWKLDGLTVVLDYFNGELVRVATRGNGIEGTDITHLKNYIEGYPLTIPYKNHFTVRGECLISKLNFKKLNESLTEEYANPRNLVSGTLNLDDEKEVLRRHPIFKAFRLTEAEDIDLTDWGEKMNLLDSLGFNTVEREEVTADELQEVIDDWTKMVDSYPYQVDGLVLDYADDEYAKRVNSETKHHNTGEGFAFKWKDDSVDTELEYIRWSCSANVITPVAVFKKIQICGTDVTQASLSNLSVMESLLGIPYVGQPLKTIKANMVIPQIVEAEIGMGDEPDSISIPDVCPICGKPTKINTSKSGTKTLVCTNDDCDSKFVNRLKKFVSKDGFDIDGVSYATLKFLNDKGWIESYVDLFTIKNKSAIIREWKNTKRYGEASVNNFLDSVEKSRKVTLSKLLTSLTIPLIGSETAKAISKYFDGDIRNLLDKIEFGKLKKIKMQDFGDKKRASFAGWFEDNYEEFYDLLDQIEVEKEDFSEASVSLSGKTFCITGEVHLFKNRDAFKAYVESCGGKVSGSVSKKTNYLVINDLASTSSKAVKAREFKIPLLSEEKFVEMFGGV